MAGKTILILGGGVGGLIAANELRRLLPDQHRVVLVEKNARHAFAPSFRWLMTGDRKPEQITQDVRQLVRPGVEVVVAEAQSIDLANRQVQTSAQGTGGFETHPYDYLIVTRGDFTGVGYCMLEAGESLAGFAYGNFFAEPSPQVELRQLGQAWHVGKVLFEKWWLAPYGLRREALHLALQIGSQGLSIPAMI